MTDLCPWPCGGVFGEDISEPQERIRAESSWTPSSGPVAVNVAVNGHMVAQGRWCLLSGSSPPAAAVARPILFPARSLPAETARSPALRPLISVHVAATLTSTSTDSHRRDRLMTRATYWARVRRLVTVATTAGILIATGTTPAHADSIWSTIDSLEQTPTNWSFDGEGGYGWIDDDPSEALALNPGSWAIRGGVQTLRVNFEVLNPAWRYVRLNKITLHPDKSMGYRLIDTGASWVSDSRNVTIRVSLLGEKGYLPSIRVDDLSIACRVP
jgi:hypothetical protein